MMERKRFLGTVAAIGGVMAAAAAAAPAAFAAPSSGAPGSNPSPMPTGSTEPKHSWRRNDTKSNENIKMVRRHLDKVITELQHDQHDYAGHRAKALDLLNQARQELLAAEQSVQSTPAPTAHPG